MRRGFGQVLRALCRDPPAQSRTGPLFFAAISTSVASDTCADERAGVASNANATKMLIVKTAAPGKLWRVVRFLIPVFNSSIPIND